ncbi:MAG: FecR domain-containing protein [Deltaproteobacteria bacterium]|nr:FecR domain-containing protein [Deltaproteobacteria bacterium]
MSRFISILTMALLGLSASVWAADSVSSTDVRMQAVGFVAAVRAPAWLERAGAKIEPRIGEMLRVGDILCTGKKGRLKVLMSDDSVIALGSKSRLVLDSHRFAAKTHQRSTSLRLIRGRVRALVHKLVADEKPDFEVRTRTAVAGVRGTEFLIIADDEGAQVRLVTFSGSVSWASGQAEPVLVAAGQGCDLGEQGKVGEVEAVAAVDLKALRQSTDAESRTEALAWNLPMDKVGDPLGPVQDQGELDQEPLSESDHSDDPQRGGDQTFGGDILTETGGQGDVEVSGYWDQPTADGLRTHNFQLTIRLRP